MIITAVIGFFTTAYFWSEFKKGWSNLDPQEPQPKNVYYPVKRVEQQQNEIMELCESSSLCFMNENSQSTELLAILSEKSKDTRFNFVLIVDPVPEPKPIDPPSDPAANSYLTFSQVELSQTIDAHCKRADLCLLGKDFSMDQLQNSIKSIGHGNKSIKFMIFKD